MKRKFKLSALLANMVLALFFGLGMSLSIEAATGVFIDPLALSAATFTVGLAANIVPLPSGLAMMAIQKEIWVQDIAENLFPENSFVSKSVDDSPFVIGGKTVHLPQAGANPTVVKNRTTLPATVTKRTDTDSTYNLDEYSTDPIVVTNTEEIEVSYTKRQSVLQQHMDTLNTRIADELAYIWAATTAANIVRSTGTARSAYATGATGTRKAITKDDIIELRRVMNRMDIPDDGNRILLVPTDLMTDLLKITEFVDANKYGQSNIPGGALGRIFGFQVFERSRATVYDNTGTPVKKAVGAAGAATDNMALQAFHPFYVRRAVGIIDVFMNEQDATYYGDVFSAAVRVGGKAARLDEKGIVALVETWVS